MSVLFCSDAINGSHEGRGDLPFIQGQVNSDYKFWALSWGFIRLPLDPYETFVPLKIGFPF